MKNYMNPQFPQDQKQILSSSKVILTQKLFKLVIKHFQVSSHLFNQKKFQSYPQFQYSQVTLRGGLPNFTPIFGHRFELKVDKLYDNGNDTWLSKDCASGEWAIGYHGIQFPDQKFQGKFIFKKFLQSFDPECKIQQLLDLNKYLKEVNKKYKNMPNVNNKTSFLNKSKVGEGIQLSPHYEQILLNVFPFSQQNQTFYLILECRFNPNFLIIPKSFDDVWVLPGPKYIRPTAIIVFTKESFNKIDQLVESKKIPYRKFQWLTYQQKYKEFIKPSSLTVIDINKIGTNNLTILNIPKGHDNKPLGSGDMIQLVKANLDNVKSINLKQNKIGDEGLKTLANKGLDSLQKIELSNNDITIRGVKYLIETSWNDKAQIKLSSVKQWKSEGIILDIDKNISTIKQLQSKLPDQILDTIYSITEKQENNFLQSANLFFQMKQAWKTPEMTEQSKKIEEQILESYKKSNQNQSISLEVALKTLKDDYLTNTAVNYSNKSTVLSKLSCGIIFGGMMDERIKFNHRITQFYWEYNTILQDDDKLQEYVAWYKKKIMKQFGLDSEESIIIHSISKGSIIQVVSIDLQQGSKVNDRFKSDPEVKVVPFFENFQLSTDDFDNDGDYQFPSIQKAETQTRAGLPYYQPVEGHRYGLNVKNKYDKGSEKWLAMNGCAQQWANAFHGMNHPDQLVHKEGKNVTRLKNVLDGLNTGTMLVPGPRQDMASRRAINKEANELVGNGIYFTPHFQTSLFHYTEPIENNQQKYRLIFQCRLKPTQIRIAETYENYWVVPSSKHVRPYGIILFTQKNYQKIKDYLINKGKKIIHRPFSWEQSKTNFYKFLSASKK